MKNSSKEFEGILPVNKPKGQTAFSLVRALRKQLNISKIGHAGTLDPFATGVMVMLIGRPYTRFSDKLLNQDKEYTCTLTLGVATDSHDCDGVITSESDYTPTAEEVEAAVAQFQGDLMQIPPMFSAKKVNGKKLYELARKGETIERKPCRVHVRTKLLSYTYPTLTLHVSCSKGTYIRSIARDLGEILQCGAHLSSLERLRSGQFNLDQCLDGEQLDNPELDLNFLQTKLHKTL